MLVKGNRQYKGTVHLEENPRTEIQDWKGGAYVEGAGKVEPAISCGLGLYPPVTRQLEV
jgi:hypothetical protein